MSSPEQLLQMAQEAGIKLYLEDGKLKYEAVESAVDTPLMSSIRQEKNRLVDYLRGREASEPASTEAGHFPMSFSQERLWFVSCVENIGSTYNVPLAISLRGQLNVAALETAYERLLQRHTVLRTVFRSEDGDVRSELLPASDMCLERIELGATTAADKTAQLDAVIKANTEFPFALDQGSLIRAALVTAAPDEHVFLLCFHHILVDGWSVGILIRELSEFYNAECVGRAADLPPLPLQFDAYVRWQRNYVGTAEFRTHLNYWEETLKDLPPVHDLPLDRPRPLQQSYAGGVHTTELPRAMQHAIKALCRKMGVTEFMFYYSALSLLLSVYSGKEDIVIGAPTTGRERKEFEGLVGYLGNLLALRANLTGNPSFEDLLARHKELLIDAYSHQAVPFDLLVEKLATQRAVNHAPVFQVLLSLQNNRIRNFGFHGLEAEHIACTPQTSKYDLSVHINEINDQAYISWEFASDLFEASTIQRMADNFEALIGEIVARPEARLSEYDVLTSAERHLVLSRWNDTGAWFPADKNLFALFAEQAAKTPEATAVIKGSRELSYRQLYEGSLAIAQALRQRLDAGAAPVAICMERTPDLLMTMLGVVACGRAYLPLDGEYPQDRLDYMLQDCGVKLTVASKRYAEKLQNLHTKVVCFEDMPAATGTIAADACSTGSEMAYVIYTSGSKGKPKGVMIPHRSVSAFLWWAKFNFSREELSSVLASTSVCFDLSLFEFFAPLVSGGRVVVVDNILDLIDTHALPSISLINTVPSAAQALVLEGAVPASVIAINLAGEALHEKLVDDLFKARPGLEYVRNLYGPSEDTTYSTWSVIDRHTRHVTIGKPIWNTAAYVVDSHDRLLPIGAIGELLLSGDGLALGYINSPELTRQKFTANPFSPEKSARLYRTGDLVRRLPDGQLEFHGRADSQVKLHGFRIELGEIENTLLRHPRILECAVMVRMEAGKDKLLLCYAVCEQPLADKRAEEQSRHELAQFLGETLPYFMIPDHFIFLQKLPRTLNGKIDRKALPQFTDEVAAPAASQPLLNEVERRLCAIWSEVLQNSSIGLDDSFFDIGGRSLLLVKLKAKIRKAFGKDMPLMDLFRHVTIRQQALALASVPGQAAAEPLPTAPDAQHEAIAIVGMAGRFPGAADVDEFWRNVASGRESGLQLSKEALLALGVPQSLVDAPDYIKRVMRFDGAFDFDNRFFGIADDEARYIDPQTRVLLQTAVHALEHAGYAGTQHNARVGVVVGKSSNSRWTGYLQKQHAAASQVEMFYLTLRNEREYLAQQLSHNLGLSGPSINVATACSTSLVAVHDACLLLRSGSCDLALAGGVSVSLGQDRGYLYQPGFIASADGYCRPFDTRASGSVAGSGAGLVVLKRLSDALRDNDSIYAVIKGAAVNNDADRKIGFAAPSVDGQAEVLRQAYANANVDPASVHYIETHGSGTPLGDAVEIAALSRVFPHASGGQHTLGAVKASIGHLDVAAGIAGLIKTIQVLRHRTVPPLVNYRSRNPDIEWDKANFELPQTAVPWRVDGTGVRRAGVSSFGIGGTNAHVILEEAPAVIGSASAIGRPVLLPLSARTSGALRQRMQDLCALLSHRMDLSLEDMEYTLWLGRRHHECRLFLTGSTPAELVDALGIMQADAAVDTTPPLAYTRQLALVMHERQAENISFLEFLQHRSEVFRTALLEAVEWVHRALWPGSVVERVDLREETRRFADEPLLWSRLVHYCLAKYWRSLGLAPSLLIASEASHGAALCSMNASSYDAFMRLLAAYEERSFAENVQEGVKAPIPVYLAAARAEVRIDESRTCDDASLYGSHHDEHLLVLDMPACSLLALRDFTDVNVAQPQWSDTTWLRMLGELWQAGIGFDHGILFEGRRPRRVALPLYPFEKRHFAPDVAHAEPITKAQAAGVQLAPADVRNQLMDIWKSIFGIDEIYEDDNFFQIGGDSLQALRLAGTINQKWGVKLSVKQLYAGATLQKLSDTIVNAAAAAREPT